MEENLIEQLLCIIHQNRILFRQSIKIPVRFGLILAVMLSQGCASTQGYSGKERPSEELAIIYAPKPRSSLKAPVESVVIHKVNDIEMGNAVKGFPQHVDVLPGEVSLEVKYLKTTWATAIGGALIAGPASPLVAGLLGSTFSNASSYAQGGNKSLTVEVEQGKSYILQFNSENHTVEDLELWVEYYSPDQDEKIDSKEALREDGVHPGE